MDRLGKHRWVKAETGCDCRRYSHSEHAGCYSFIIEFKTDPLGRTTVGADHCETCRQRMISRLQKLTPFGEGQAVFGSFYF